MPSRRAVLGAGSVVAASALAGCGVLGGEDGEPARFGRGATAPADPEVVALADAETGEAPAGRMASSTAAFERADGRIVVVGFHRIRAGEVAFGSGFRYANVESAHDWSATEGSVVGEQTNTTTVDADSPDAAFRVASASGDRSRSWRVALPEPSTDAVAYRFRTTFDPAGQPTAGDALATVRGASKLTDGSLLGGTKSVEATLELVYGDTTVEN
jgi:hypothetical protein